VRIAYSLFTQKPKEELADFATWARTTKPGTGDDFYRHNGAGEMLVYSAADFEDFMEPQMELPASMKGDLKAVVALLGTEQMAVPLARDLRRNDWPRP
jgi:predicted amidohydrolase YtcJ